jgi:hypothetical protein
MPTTYAIPDGRTVMAATLYTGNGYSTSGTQNISNAVNGVSFQPDWVWGKQRTVTNHHWLVDSVRGSSLGLYTDLTNGENTNSNEVTGFNSNGFGVGASAAAYMNGNGNTMVAWQWKAGGTAASNTAGTITSSVSSNTTAGFSVVTFTGNGTAGATVGHGCQVGGVATAPSMIITKSRATSNWPTYHVSLGNTKGVYVNSTLDAQPSSNFWYNTSPSTTVFSLGSGSSDINVNTTTYVAYCFAAVAGYSAFGSYTGNNSTDGPFVYLGFRPRWILIKCSSTNLTNWHLQDTSRSPYNAANNLLFPNLTNGDYTTAGVEIDILSNGFKIRDTNADYNASGATFVYACFAENPFKYANAR